MRISRKPLSLHLPSYALLSISLALNYKLTLLMEQIREQVLQNPFRCLDLAAEETTAALARADIRYGFIGGYATSLIGGPRMTSLPYIF
jgi:hypothetical protein